MKKILTKAGELLGIKIVSDAPLIFTVPYNIMKRDNKMSPEYYEKKYFVEERNHD